MKYKWTLYWLSIIYSFFCSTQTTIMTVLFKNLKHSFNVNDAALGGLSGMMFYIFGIMQPFVGYLIDKYGPKLTITYGSLCLGLGTIFFGCAPNLFVAYFARALTGLGSCAFFITLIYIPSHYFEKEKVGFLSTLAIGLYSIGSVFELIVTPVLLRVFGWRTVVIGHGVAILIVCLFTFILLRNLKEKHASHNPFIFVSGLIKNIKLWNIILVSTFSYFLFGSFVFLWAVPYFMNEGYSIHMSGLLCTAFLIAAFLFSPKIGHIADHYFSKKILVIATLCLTLIIMSLMLYFKFHLWILFVLMFLLGGVASGRNLTYILSYEGVNPKAKGLALGLTNLAVVGLSGVSQSVVGQLIEHLKSFNYAMWFYPITIAIALVFSLFFPNTKKT